MAFQLYVNKFYLLKSISDFDSGVPEFQWVWCDVYERWHSSYEYDFRNLLEKD